MIKTFAPNPNKVERKWILVDANAKILGKLAVEISQKLMGKNKPQYAPNANVGDNIVVINAEKIQVTSDKKQTKIYTWHTGFPKGLRQASLETVLAKNPTNVLRKAIKGMLPKNKLQKERMANLHIYAGTKHPHTAQISKQI